MDQIVRIAVANVQTPSIISIPASWEAEPRRVSDSQFADMQKNGFPPLQTLYELGLTGPQIRQLPDSIRVPYERQKNEFVAQRNAAISKSRVENMVDAQRVIRHIVDEMWLWIISSSAPIILYGTATYLRYGRGTRAFDYLFTFQTVPDTYDIDIATENPIDFSINMYRRLFGYCAGSQFQVHGKFFTVDELNLVTAGERHSISLMIRYQAYHVCRCVVMDCMSFQDAHFSVVPVNNVRMQSPKSYICGMVDKLYNAYLNPRINQSYRAAAKANMILRFEQLQMVVSEWNDDWQNECAKFDCFNPTYNPNSQQTLKFLQILVTQGSATALKYYNT